MKTKTNARGEEVYIFDQYPGLEVRPEVLNVADIAEMAPIAGKHPRITRWLMHLLKMDRANQMHQNWAHTPGPEFTDHIIHDELNIDLQVEGMENLEQFRTGPFITVSNHPFGHIDGIALIYIVSRIRPDYKVMVNMILDHVSAMRPNFIAVDQSQSDDPEKRAISVAGVREAISMLREGKPVGFFPAGAIGMADKDGIITDRPWQKTVLQIIQKAKVPVIPIYFHGKNSRLFTWLGHHCVTLRTAMLVRELVKKANRPMKVTIGRPISVAKQAEFGKDYEALGWYLRMQTYDLSGRHVTTLSK